MVAVQVGEQQRGQSRRLGAAAARIKAPDRSPPEELLTRSDQGGRTRPVGVHDQAAGAEQGDVDH